MFRQLTTGLARTRLISLGTAMAAIAAPALANDPPPQLVAAHFRCSSQAQERLMAPVEAEICMRIYLKLKLSILGTVNFEDYQRLPPDARARINASAYRAFLAWREGTLEHGPTGRWMPRSWW